MKVSVVVPTFNRPDLLERCLASLLAQDFDPTQYEIIVADDAASDATRQQLEAIAGKASVDLRYLPVTRAHGPAAARNLGWREARGEIIAFTDDDTIPQRDWLKTGTSVFSYGPAAAWGRIEMPLPDRPTDYQRDAAGLARTSFVTANCFCRRDVLEAVGGFDERFTAAWREDSDLFFTLLEHGYEVRHIPQAVVVHPIRPAHWGVSLRQQRKCVFNALLYRKHPVLYRKNIPPLPRDYYAMVGALILALGGALSGYSTVAWWMAGVWAGLTGRFCARRLKGTSRAPLHITEMIVTSVLLPPLSLYANLRGAYKYRAFYF
jgi:glycosyltransferase involved in cell wall biosynthesis